MTFPMQPVVFANKATDWTYPMLESHCPANGSVSAAV